LTIQVSTTVKKVLERCTPLLTSWNGYPVAACDNPVPQSRYRIIPNLRRFGDDGPNNAR